MANRGRADDEVEEVEEEEEEAPRRRNPLRLIILILLALVGLCVICYLGSSFLGNSLVGALPFSVPGLEQLASPAPGDTPAPLPTEEVPVVDTTEPAPTEPPATTTEPLPTTDPALPPATDEPIATGEPGATEEPVVTTEPTDEGIDEPTPTVQAVPGPTATPTTGPAPGTTPQADCSANTPPTADAGDPTTSMMGKGQAFVTFDGSGSSDAEGTIVTYEWDFGDGEQDNGQSVTHGYGSAGAFDVTLTVTDNCGETGQDTVQVTITGPTPPAPTTTPAAGTPTASPPALPPTGQTDPTAGTMGFCYLVQPNDSLSGIAAYYNLPLLLLAEVNGISPDYLWAGQGLFIPTGQVQPGPNVYVVQPGDTLDSIAYQCGLFTNILAGANGLAPGQSLMPGQLVGIPLWPGY